MATISKIPREYSVQFEYKLTECPIDAWYNIIHIITGFDKEIYGSRIASVFPQCTHGNIQKWICSPVNGNWNYCAESIPTPKNKWVMVKVSQVKMGNDYVYKVEVDGNKVKKVNNAKPMEFENVTVYVSDPWHDAPLGSIRNLIIKGKFLLIIFGQL